MTRLPTRATRVTALQTRTTRSSYAHRVPRVASSAFDDGTTRETDARARLEDLRAWLGAFERFSDRGVRLTASDADGFGVRAVCAAPRGIARGDVVVEVPREAFLVGGARGGGGAFGRLVAALLAETAAGERSRWWPYVRTLPSDGEWHPLLWSEETRAARLPTWSDAGARLAARAATCAAQAEALRATDVGEDGARPTERDVRWASAVCSSRAFRLNLDGELDDGDEDDESDAAALAEDEALLRNLSDLNDDEWDVGGDAVAFDDVDEDVDSSALALVPWADALNHSSDADESALLRYDARTRTAKLCAHTSYALGEQVFDSYGLNLSDTELFLDYGFVDVRRARASEAEFTGRQFVDVARDAFGDARLGVDFVEAESVILRVNAESGVGENALAFADYVLTANGSVSEDEVVSHALRTFLRLCDDALARVDEAFVAGCADAVKRCREGESLHGELASAYVIARECDGLRRAREAVRRQLDDELELA